MARKVSPSQQIPTSKGNTSGNKTAGSNGYSAGSPAAGRGASNPYNGKQITSQRKEPPAGPPAPAGAKGSTSGNRTAGSSAKSPGPASSASKQTIPLTRDADDVGPGWM